MRVRGRRAAEMHLSCHIVVKTPIKWDSTAKGIYDDLPRIESDNTEVTIYFLANGYVPSPNDYVKKIPGVYRGFIR